MQIKLAKEIYPKEAILKAAYKYVDGYRVLLDSNESHYMVELVPRESVTGIEEQKLIETEFINDVLVQTVRYSIVQQTSSLREIVVGRALASTILEERQQESADSDSMHAGDILCDWFDKYDE